jgi:hypothetical protein
VDWDTRDDIRRFLLDRSVSTEKLDSVLSGEDKNDAGILRSQPGALKQPLLLCVAVSPLLLLAGVNHTSRAYNRRHLLRVSVSSHLHLDNISFSLFFIDFFISCFYFSETNGCRSWSNWSSMCGKLYLTWLPPS